MAITSGTRLGPYEVVAPLGAGGMGEVWRGRDTRLERSVAIKVLPAEFAENAQFKLRFEREAKTISQLNHPHICTLYDVGEAEISGAPAPSPASAAEAAAPHRVSYLVMELLEGESLADRVARGPLPVGEVLKYGVQIAEALDKAHKAGVVHRDLKPGNIMITKSGAKLLDFGLAKSGAVAITGDGSTALKPLTAEGTIVGTFQYMAPEQVEGKEIDHRVDIWALGCVLYEMATGRAPFTGTSHASLIGAIMKGEPAPPSRVQPIVPLALDRIIKMCLAKDADDRWQSARDAATELQWISDAPVDSPRIPLPSRPARVARAIAFGTAIFVAAVLALAISRSLRGFHLGSPVVVMMDSTHPERVYDPETRQRGGTNADDLTDLLHDLPVALVKENTSWTWHREDEVLRQNPDLILIHRSCFYVPSGGNNAAFEREFYERASDKLEIFLGYIALGNPRTKFLVYSRRSWKDDAERDRWVASLVKRFPQMKGRVSAWSVPLDRATFRHPQTGAEMKKQVIAVLGVKSP